MKIGVKEAAEKLGVNRSRVTVLCREGRIKGATKKDGEWKMPAEPVILAGGRQRPGKLTVIPKKK